ncbi:MAG: 6-bladed beta-propeller [Candidatus Aminicenantes bacterium]|nr:6-bladed beta-propeller [Candidatus Aminicenantes bacterium]
MMNKIPLFFLLGMISASPFAFPQAPQANLDIRTEQIFTLGKGDILFSSIDSVCEDAQKNVYVLDRKASKVYKFSPEGKLFLSFGNKGQGPGEFQSPHDIFIAQNGNIFISEDMAFVTSFDSEGQFIRRISAEKGLALTFLEDNFFYAWTWNEGGQTQLLVDKEGNTLKTFFSVSNEDSSISAPDESGRQVRFNFSTPEITPSFIFNRFQNHFVVAINNRYEFSLFDSQGTILSTVKRDLKPPKLSTKERDFLLTQMKETRDWPDWIMKLIRKNIAKTKTFFDNIRVSDKFIFVFRVRDNLTDNNSRFPVDIFDLDGDFLGSSSLSTQPLFISDFFMYAVVYDEEDNLLLQKFQYKIIE